MNTRTLQLMLALTAGAALLLSGCGMRETRVQHGDREQILHLGNGTEPQDLDPHTVTGVPEHRIIKALLEGLVGKNPETQEPEPGVAERWEVSPDSRIYTFHFREDALWSNGDPVTAHDFVNAYRRILTPSLGSRYADMLYIMENAEAFNTGKITEFSEVGAKALDDRTLEIRLTNPTHYFLSMLTHYTWFPVHLPTIEQHGPVYEPGNRWTRPENYVGNGPFVLKEWRPHRRIVVEKSPTYWDADTVRLNEIHFYPIDSQDTEERAFRSGQLHITDQVPLTRIGTYREQQPEVIRFDPWLGTYYYTFNVTRPPLDDVRVRQALALAIDREGLVEQVLQGGQTPAYHFAYPGVAGYYPAARFHADVERARELLAEAGYPDGSGLPALDILFNTHEWHRTVAEAIQQMWRRNLNIDARLYNQEWQVYLDSMNRLDYQVARAGWIGDYEDPNTFLDMWVTGRGNNRTGWSNAEYDDLLLEAAREVDPEARLALFDRAEALLLDEMPIMPIFFYTRVYLISPSVRGWHPNIMDYHPYKYVWLEPRGNDSHE